MGGINKKMEIAKYFPFGPLRDDGIEWGTLALCIIGVFLCIWLSQL
jgi:hypothetical protein